MSPSPPYSLDHLHSSVPFPGAPPYLSNRAIWLGPYTTALHLYACHTCPDLFSTIWPYSPLVYSVVPSSSPPPSPLRLALGCHPQTLWPSHSQPSSTLRRPQLQAKPFLLLLTQKRSSHLSSQKEEWHPSPYCLQSKRRALQSLFLKWRADWVIPEWTERPERCWLSQGKDQ